MPWLTGNIYQSNPSFVLAQCWKTDKENDVSENILIGCLATIERQ